MKTLDAMEKYIKGKRLTVWSKAQYEWVIRKFAKYSEEWPDGPAVINEWLASLKVCQDTARTYLAVLMSMGEYMRKNYDMPNPCDRVEKIQREEKKRRYLKPDEEIIVLSACKYGYDRELVLALAGSLCRIGELGYDKRDPKHNPGLKGKDVGDGFIVVRGKTGEKRYKLDKVVCEALRQLAGSPDGYVFKAGDGVSPATVGHLKERVRRVFKRSGIGGKKLGAHTLRHSGASLVAKSSNLNVLAVKGILQHKRIETSMEYIHDAEEDAVEGINVLELIRDSATKPDVEVKQMELGEEGVENMALVPVGFRVEVEDSGRLLDDAFPDIEEGIKIRPQLSTEDLRLLRSLMVVCFNTGIGRPDALRGRGLLRRMLRKSG